MRRLVHGIHAAALVAALLAVPAIHAREEKVPTAQVPAPVMDTVKARFAHATVTAAGKETEKGRLVYEVTLEDGGRHVDVTVTPAGDLLMIEKAIPAAELPAPVTQALAGKYPGATYRIVEEIVEVDRKRERLVYYEVALVTSTGKTKEVQVTPDGTHVSEEEEEDGGEEEEGEGSEE